MSKKGGLGKGLEALFEENYENSKEIFFLELEKIEPNKNQPRKNFNEETLSSLADSIKNNGVIQPILVRKIDDDRYQIVAGERRFRAAKIVGLKEIPVVVKEVKDENVTEIALIENLQRENLNPIEEAKSFLSLVENYGLTQNEVAKKVGKSRSAVTNTIRLLNLPQEVRKEIENGNLTSGQARALLAFKNDEDVKNFAVKVIENGMSVRNIEKIANFKRSDSKRTKTKKENKNHIFKELEQNLQEDLKRNVLIEIKSGEKGRLIVEFHNRDELVFMAYKILELKNKRSFLKC